VKLVELGSSAMLQSGAYQYGFISRMTMIRLYRVVGLIAICFAVSNCAGPPILTSCALVQPLPTRVASADDAFWSTEPEPVGRTHHHPKAETASAPIAPASAPHVTTESAPTDTPASVDATDVAKPGQRRWSEPKWSAEEKAEMERLRRVTNICRC